MKEQLLIQKLNHLLSQERLLREERLIHGELFNIFQVMKMETDELNTHSALLASLLNPNGIHGCGDTFLKLFIEQIREVLCSKDSLLTNFYFETSNARVHTEYSIGQITEGQSGGRIDILVSSGDKAIILENKIYADDIKNQIFRYHEFAMYQNYKQFVVLYLSLFGTPPSDKSKGLLVENKDFYCISYAYDIKQWLEKCLKEVTFKPLIRETIMQYKNLIEKLTNQDMETKVIEQLSEICLEPENIDSILWMHSHFDNMVNKYMKTKLEPILNEIASREGLRLEIKGDGKDWMNTSYMYFLFEVPNWNYFDICFEFQTKGMKKLVSGYRYKNEKRGQSKDGKHALQTIDLDKGKTSEGWPRYHYLENMDNWITKEMFQKIENKESLKNDIISEIEILLKKVKEKGIKEI